MHSIISILNINAKCKSKVVRKMELVEILTLKNVH